MSFTVVETPVSFSREPALIIDCSDIAGLHCGSLAASPSRIAAMEGVITCLGQICGHHLERVIVEVTSLD